MTATVRDYLAGVWWGFTHPAAAIRDAIRR